MTGIGFFSSGRVRRLFPFTVAAVMAATGCGDNLGETSFDVRGSVEQVHVTRAASGAEIELVDAGGSVVEVGTADEQGSLIFRGVSPGAGYTVRLSDTGERSLALEVMSVDNSTPPQSFYDGQVLEPGFGYIETRDGTLLSVYVQLPGPVEDGPYPTLINYSGYEPSQPGAPLDVPGIEGLCELYPVLCDAPNHPSGLIAGVLGYATVGVNMRGTGCSGGAYDFFEPLQLLDGYDVIETVAAQSWVHGNKVGMAGLSFPGITQLFVASTRPPSLAAITPLSVISDVQSTLVPGGILNDGFAVSWGQRVQASADPFGQGWEQARVDEGDEICRDNQLLHSQKVDIIAKAYANPFYVPEVADPINLNLKVPEIDVPVFLAGAWQDEQTGPGFASLLDRFERSPLTRFTVYNGVHPDGYAPHVLVEWNNFLSFYVADRIPEISGTIRTLAPMLFQEQYGADIDIPADRFTGFDSVEEARAAYEAEPVLRAIFDVGAADGETIGAPVGAFEATFDEWMPADVTPHRLFMHGDGVLRSEPPADVDGASQFSIDRDEGQRLQLAPGGDIWALLPEFDWRVHEPGRAIVFETEPLAEDAVMMGHASVDLFIQASAADADIEVTISEVRPDGQEMYVQSGWLRASMRALAADATELRPTKTFREADVVPLPAGAWESARVEVFAFGHAFRAGSRIRVSIDTPGGSRAEWRFALGDYPADTTVMVAHHASNASSVVLPLIQGMTAPTPLPPCPSLRAQPCRTYQAHSNTPAP